MDGLGAREGVPQIGQVSGGGQPTERPEILRTPGGGRH